LREEALTITTGDGDFEAFVVRPAAEDPRPALVLIQEIFGVNYTMRRIAQAFAERGNYVTVAPDLFWRFEPGIDLDDRKPDELQRAFGLFPRFDVDAGLRDIAATIDQVRGQSWCNGKVGAVGYCLGGLLAFLTATRTDADAVVSYYGVNIDKQLGEADHVRRPLMLHIAGEDQFVPKAAQAEILARLKDRPGVQIHVYPDRDHAFAREGGHSYEPEAAATANARTLSFLKQALG
jgi:carboxymethylenebutenolidase